MPKTLFSFPLRRVLLLLSVVSLLVFLHYFSLFRPFDLLLSSPYEEKEIDQSPHISSLDTGDSLDTGNTLLNQLVIQASPLSIPQTPYSRDFFGQRWKDMDRNGCDTRNDILAQDLREVEKKQGSCRVLRGILEDPYSGKRIQFQRGQGTSELVQIDHIVPLADAWAKGADSWSQERREEFANDPMNLIAVDGDMNQQKLASDAAGWLPPQESFRCEYIRKQVAVKTKYSVQVSPREYEVMSEILSSAFCSNSR